MKTTPESSQTPALDHDQLAHDADIAYHALARIGHQLGRVDPVAGTAGRALIDTCAGLAELRRTFDEHRTVVELCSSASSPYYPTRNATLTAATRAAARIAIAATWPYGTDEHANADRAQRGTLRGTAGPSATESRSSDDDPGAPLDGGAALGPAAAAAPASCAIAATDDQRHAETGCTATQPHSAIHAV